MEGKCIIFEKRLSVQIKASKEAGFYLVGKPSGVITGQTIVACVASVSARVRRQSWITAKQKGGGREGRKRVSSSPLPLLPLFCVITPSETFATQAKNIVVF